MASYLGSSRGRPAGSDFSRHWARKPPAPLSPTSSKTRCSATMRGRRGAEQRQRKKSNRLNHRAARAVHFEAREGRSADGISRQVGNALVITSQLFGFSRQYRVHKRTDSKQTHAWKPPTPVDQGGSRPGSGISPATNTGHAAAGRSRGQTMRLIRILATIARLKLARYGLGARRWLDSI